jgi:hypothetical protein
VGQCTHAHLGGSVCSPAATRCSNRRSWARPMPTRSSWCSACRSWIRSTLSLQPPQTRAVPYSDDKAANRNVGDFGREIAHGAVSRRPPISLRHDGTPYRGLRVRRWGLGFVHRSRAIFCRPVPNARVTIRNFVSSLYTTSRSADGRSSRETQDCESRTPLRECVPLLLGGGGELHGAEAGRHSHGGGHGAWLAVGSREPQRVTC